MTLLRLYEYSLRVLSVFFTALPGGYRNRKLEILRHFFTVTNGFMQQTGVDYWLDFGTLLGHYREGDIVRHDIDIDFGTHEENFQKIWEARRLLPKGFKIYDETADHRGAKIYINYKGYDCDIYFYEDLGDSIRSFENSKHINSTQLIPKSLIFPVKEAEFLSQPTKVPAKMEPYLTTLYGYLGKDGVRNKKTGFWTKKADG